jgi:hypothetical protein
MNKLKKNYVTESINSKNCKKMWNAMNNLTGATPNHLFNSSLWNSACEECDDLNHLFSSYFLTDSPAHFTDIDTCELPSCVITLSIGEVKNALKNLKKCSPGVDCIPTWVYKTAADDLALPVTVIFNESFHSGIVPKIFKMANITPVPKCKRPNKNEFRPISNLPILSKIMEHFAVKGWIGHLWNNFSSNQFAFIKGRGTGTTCALTHLNCENLRFLDTAPGVIRLLLLDYSKAFDKTLCSTVLNALCKLGVSSQGVFWWYSFMSERQQRVKIDNSASEWSIVTSGIPQGSVSGPVCFAAVNEALSVQSKNSTITKYADDNTIAHFIRRKTEDSLQEEFNNLQDQTLIMGLQLNTTKTKELRISTKLKDMDLAPLVAKDGTTIEVVKTAKLLGCILSEDLKWNTHVNNILATASSRLYLLTVLKRAGTPTIQLQHFYKAKIRSILSYGFPAICNMPAYLQTKLESIENRASNIIGQCVTPCLRDFLSHSAQRLAYDSNNPEHRLHNLFVMNTRKNKITAPKCKTTRFKDSFLKYANEL